MDFITSQPTTRFVVSGRDEGVCAIDGHANVAGVDGRPIRVRIHGGRVVMSFCDFHGD